MNHINGCCETYTERAEVSNETLYGNFVLYISLYRKSIPSRCSSVVNRFISFSQCMFSINNNWRFSVNSNVCEDLVDEVAFICCAHRRIFSAIVEHSVLKTDSPKSIFG